MAVTLTGTSSGAQGLFNRLGAIGYRLGVLNAARSAFNTDAAAAMVLCDGASAAIRGCVSDLPAARLQGQSALGTFASAYRSAAERLLIQMFDDDAPLSKRDKETALRALLKQMRTATTSKFDSNTVAASVTQTSLTGNGNTVVSIKDGLGYTLENLLAERILLDCTGNTTSGSESIRVRGELSEPNKLSHNWPLGSGANITLTSIDAAASDNLLTNGDLEDFTANVPDSWSLITGTAGTHVLQETSTVYKGSKALKYVGDGSNLTQIRQAITGLDPQTPYAVNLWLRNSSNPSTGTLIVDLYDGSAVINDEAGNANSLSIDLTTLGTTYVAKSADFRLPDPVPDNVYLRLRLSVAIENTKTTYIDHISFAEMTKLSTSQPGATPWIAVFSGATDWSLDDGNENFSNVWTIETTNDRASEWQTLMDRLFDTSALGITFPVSGSTLINDSLIA